MLAKKAVLPAGRLRRQLAIARTVNDLPAADVAVGRIAAMLAEATDAECADGVAWYPAASEIALAVGRKAHAHPAHALEVGAGVLAALSPRLPWDTNIVRAFTLAGDPAYDNGLGDGLAKARRIMAGEAPAAVLGGRKVRSFFANIVGNPHAVTIDSHALAIVMGRPLTDRQVRVIERIGAYSYVAACYRAAARQAGFLPCEMQAITWLAWRREHAWEAREYEDF